MTDQRAYRRTTLAVLLLTFGIGVGEAVWGRLTGSAYITRDGLEWGYGIVIYAIGLATFGRSAAAERWGGYLSAAVLALGGGQGLIELVASILHQDLDDSVGNLAFSAAVSLSGSAIVALLLAKFRRSTDSAVNATWLSARNDFIASAFDAGVAVTARVADVRWLDQASTAIGVILSFWAAWIVARKALSGRRMA